MQLKKELIPYLIRECYLHCKLQAGKAHPAIRQGVCYKQIVDNKKEKQTVPYYFETACLFILLSLPKII